MLGSSSESEEYTGGPLAGVAGGDEESAVGALQSSDEEVAAEAEVVGPGSEVLGVVVATEDAERAQPAEAALPLGVLRSDSEEEDVADGGASVRPCRPTRGRGGRGRGRPKGSVAERALLEPRLRAIQAQEAMAIVHARNTQRQAPAAAVEKPRGDVAVTVSTCADIASYISDGHWRRAANAFLAVLRSDALPLLTDIGVSCEVVSHERCVDTMFGRHLAANLHHARGLSWSAEARVVGIADLCHNQDSNAIPYCQHEYMTMAAGICFASRLQWFGFLRGICMQIHLKRLEGLMLCVILQSDEASSKMRLTSGAAPRSAKLGSQVVAWTPSYSSLGALSSTDVQTVKVQQTELKVGVVVRDVASGRITRHIAELLVPLQSVERTTAECLHAACVDALRMSGLNSSFEQKFTHSVMAVTQDLAASNQREQRAARMEDKQAGRAPRLALPCRVHRGQTGQVQTFDLLNAHVSGCVGVALNQRTSGGMKQFRDCLRHVLLARLRIVRGRGGPVPGSAAWRHKEAVFDLCFPNVRPRRVRAPAHSPWGRKSKPTKGMHQQ